jgi:hypothetical protein
VAVTYFVDEIQSNNEKMTAVASPVSIDTNKPQPQRQLETIVKVPVLKKEIKESLTGTIFNSVQEFDKWVTHYYIKPESDKIPGAIRFFADSVLFNRVNSRMSVAAFFSAVFKNNSELVRKTYEDISANSSTNAKTVLLKALWLVNNQESKGLLDKALLDWKSDEINKQVLDVLTDNPMDILNDPIKDVSQLDMLWAIFMATGDSAPIKRIISVLHLVKDGHGLDIAIGGAAQWSLSSNAVQHEKVYQICQEELSNADGETKNLLQQIIAKSRGAL